MEISTVIAAAIGLMVLAVLARLSRDKEQGGKAKECPAAIQPQKAAEARRQEETAILLAAALAEELGVSASEIKITF